MLLLSSSLTGTNISDLKRRFEETQPGIIITGPCTYEVSGVMALLEIYGYSVRPLIRKKMMADDLLIVVMSDAPELGWGKNLSSLEYLIRTFGCRIIVTVPGTLVAVVEQSINCEVIAGDVTLQALSVSLLKSISLWQQNTTIKYSKPHTVILTPAMGDALLCIMSGRGIRKRTEYSHLYGALVRLKFKKTMQFRRFIAGTVGITLSDVLSFISEHGSSKK